MLSLDEILFDEEPHTYTYRGQKYDSVTQIINQGGLGDDFSHVDPVRLEYCQRRGRMVHLACQYYNDGELNLETVHESIRGYVEAYILFRLECKIKVIACERKLITTELDFAGTPDLIAWMGGHRAVIDLKTSQSLSPRVRLQTAGYSLLWNKTYPTNPVKERYGLRLGKDGKYSLIQHTDPDDERAFIDTRLHAQSEQRMILWRTKYK
jgi:hypothetical protein